MLYALAHILPYKVRGTMWGVFFSPEVSSPTRYKETRNKSTMAAKEEKKKRGGDIQREKGREKIDP